MNTVKSLDSFLVSPDHEKGRMANLKIAVPSKNPFSVYLKLDVPELTRHLHVDMTLGPELR